MNYRDYIKQRFKEMKDEPEFKDMKPSEKTQIIANEWKNRVEDTELVVPEEKEPEKETTQEQDPELIYKYKCINGHYFNEIPEDGRCPVCKVELM